jgi:hypothetical protein
LHGSRDLSLRQLLLEIPLSVKLLLLLHMMLGLQITSFA